MRGDVLTARVGGMVYYAEEPKQANGLVATVSAIREEGKVAHIIHRDRINLDRAKDRVRFADAAGTDAADLNDVRDRLLDFLVPGEGAAPAAPAELNPAVRQAAIDLLAAPDILERAGRTIAALGYAGAPDLLKLVYLVLTSRLLARPINLVVGGPSAAGKSYLVGLVARLFPPRATYTLHGFSERLLAYTDADLTHRVLIVGEAAALHRDGIGAALLRSIAWEGNLVYETVEKTGQGLKPRRIEKPGPTGFVTTTTGRVEAELETRVLTVAVPDDPAATRTILLATAERANGHAPEAPNLAPWIEAQRWLADEGAKETTISFAPRLGERFPALQVRSRRDFSQLLGLISTSALLHQAQRERDGDGRVVAAEADYRVVYDLAAPVFGAIAAAGVTPIVRQTVEAVARLVPTPDAAPVTVSHVATALGIDKSAASRRVKTALGGEFLVNEEPGRGKPLKLRPGDSLPVDRPALPSPEDIFDYAERNGATVQPPGVDSDESGEDAGCSDGCGDASESIRDRPAGVPVDVRMQMTRQPRLSFPHRENAGVEGSGCTVAQGDVCVECGLPLPDGWDSLYCGQHGGGDPAGVAGDDRFTR